MEGTVNLLPTLDGSLTFYNKDIHQAYHSLNGALQEARHVFLENGLQFYLQKLKEKEIQVKNISILEVGFGSGLNFLINADFCESHQIHLNYTGIEPYPLSKELFTESGYYKWIHNQKLWVQLLESLPEPIVDHSLSPIGDFIRLEILKKKIQEFATEKKFDLIYFDAFAPQTQKELWEMETIRKVLFFLKPGGMFITYSITGNLKRIFRSLNYHIQKPKGAAGKR